MNAAFGMCETLIAIELPKLSNNLDSLFYKCTNLLEVDMGQVMDASYKDYFYNMFYKCTSLTKVKGFFLPSKDWDESEDIGMFKYCSNLESIYVRKPDVQATPSTDEGSWRAFAVSHGIGTSDTVTVYRTDGSVESTATVQNSDGRSVEATDWIDELAISKTGIPSDNIADMMATRTPITGNLDAASPSDDAFTLWAKSSDKKRINLSLSDFKNDMSLSDFTNDLLLPVGRPTNVQVGSVWLG